MTDTDVTGWGNPVTGPAGALLYVAGAPGAGKSTLMAALTAPAPRRTPVARPVAHEVLGCPHGPAGAVELGRRRDTYPGTDALPYDATTRACEWLGDRPARLLLGEGDRLAHLGFMQSAAIAGYAVYLVVLAATGAQLAARRAAREAAGQGRTPDPAWLAGRHTKVLRLAAWAEATGHYVLDLPTGPVPALAAAVRSWCPPLAALVCARCPSPDPGPAPAPLW